MNLHILAISIITIGIPLMIIGLITIIIGIHGEDFGKKNKGGLLYIAGVLLYSLRANIEKDVQMM